jgi:hypothetical protein
MRYRMCESPDGRRMARIWLESLLKRHWAPTCLTLVGVGATMLITPAVGSVVSSERLRQLGNDVDAIGIETKEPFDRQAFWGRIFIAPGDVVDDEVV